MKPFVAIGGVLDYLFAKYFGSVSVEKCAQTENLCCRLEAALGRDRTGGQVFPLYNRFEQTIAVLVSLTIGVQNVRLCCRWSSIFYLPAVLSTNLSKCL